MKYKCLVCGQIIDNNEMCPFCGSDSSQIVPIESEGKTGHYRCLVCGRETENGDYCPYCGSQRLYNLDSRKVENTTSINIQNGENNKPEVNKSEHYEHVHYENKNGFFFEKPEEVTHNENEMHEEESAAPYQEFNAPKLEEEEHPEFDQNEEHNEEDETFESRYFNMFGEMLPLDSIQNPDPEKVETLYRMGVERGYKISPEEVASAFAEEEYSDEVAEPVHEEEYHEEYHEEEPHFEENNENIQEENVAPEQENFIREPEEVIHETEQVIPEAEEVKNEVEETLEENVGVEQPEVEEENVGVEQPESEEENTEVEHIEAEEEIDPEMTNHGIEENIFDEEDLEKELYAAVSLMLLKKESSEDDEIVVPLLNLLKEKVLDNVQENLDIDDEENKILSLLDALVAKGKETNDEKLLKYKKFLGIFRALFDK